MVIAKQHSTYLHIKFLLWNSDKIQLPQNALYCDKVSLFIRKYRKQLFSWLNYCWEWIKLSMDGQMYSSCSLRGFFSSFSFKFLGDKLLSCAHNQNTESVSQYHSITDTSNGQLISCNFSVLLAVERAWNPTFIRRTPAWKEKARARPPVMWLVTLDL